MKIRKPENNLAARTPRNLVKALSMRAGDDVEIVANTTKALGIRPLKIENYFAQLDALPKFHAGFVFSRDEANAR